MSDVYASEDELILRYPALVGKDGDDVASILDAASRWIDGHCHRRFWLDETATARLFAADDPYVLDLGVHEIGDSDDVIVRVDDGSGQFATTLASSDFVLEPVNAPYSTPEARPFTSIRRVTGQWPRTTVPWGRQERVQVTARYGWPAVPAAVREACLVLANEEYENPGGLSGEAIDGYSWRVSAGDDGLVGAPGVRVAIRKLAPFVRSWAA